MDSCLFFVAICIYRHSVDTGAVFIFSPSVAPDTVKIHATHVTANDDSTGNIIINPGIPASLFTLRPDSIKLSANGTDFTAVKSDTIYDNDLNPIAANNLFTISIYPKNLGF